jgi:D-alanyl-D-alanine carboxypeptidase
MRKRIGWFRILFFTLLALLALVIGFGVPLSIRLSKIKTLTEFGYSEDFAKYSLEHNLYETIRDLGYNETLSHVLMSPDYKADYYDSYLRINYQEKDNFLSLINRFLDKKYTPDDINFFFERFSDSDLEQLAEREHLDKAQEYFAESYAKLKDLDRYLAYEGKIQDAVYAVANNQDLPEYQADETRSDFAFDMLVNKNYAVSEDFEPDNLVDTEDGFQLNQGAYAAFQEMQTAAAEEGLILQINSAYRSVAEQQVILAAQCATYGQEYCESHVAQPGFSEHHTGLALDIKTPHDGTFAHSKEFNWLKEHAQEYGFIWRYQENFEKYTRFSEEAWHYRYVGKDLAAKIKDSGLSFDEYYVTKIEK